MTDSSPAPSSGVPYVGQRISLISKSAIRYVGTLYTIDTKASTVALKDVRSYGTEGRHRDGGPVEPSDRVYTFIVFRGPDITDLQFLPKDSDTPVSQHQPPQQQQIHPSVSPTVKNPQVASQHMPMQHQRKQERPPQPLPQQHQQVEMKQKESHPAPQREPRASQPPVQPPHHRRQQVPENSPPQPLQQSPKQQSQPQQNRQPQQQPQQAPQQQQQQPNAGHEVLHQKPVVRGPTPRAWGPPPVPPKEMRQTHADRQPVHASPQGALGAAGTGRLNVNGNNREHGRFANGVPNGGVTVSKQGMYGNRAGPNGNEHLAMNGGMHGNGGNSKMMPSNHVSGTGNVGGINGAVPGIGNEVMPRAVGNIHMNGVNGGPVGGLHGIQMNGDRAYRGGRGRGRGRGYGGRYHGGSWRRGPGIKIPEEDFDFASMQEKFEAATLGEDGKRGGEEAFGHVEVCYDKSRSFFDDLVPEKEMRSERVNAAQRRATDFETFGETGPGYHRSGYRSGRGRRGRGRGRGRGGRYGGGAASMNGIGGGSGVVGGAPRQDMR